ncbi:cysteine proteinase [Xylaria sp. CBS 124048]|nr:cysteine proteinase [Xylaria sp. CBS 124048]
MPAAKKQRAPQEIVDKFWARFTTKVPGKVTTVIPPSEHAEQAVRPLNKGVGKSTQASYEEAAAICRAKVDKIVKECRRVNQKYRDPYFDLELDLKLGQRDTLQSLSNAKDDEGKVQETPSDFKPESVKRVPDIFDTPRFFIDGPAANDVRQGRNGDCWLLAALCTLSNMPSLVERVCVARDEQVGVYGFVFHRDGEWISVIIDDKLFLTRPDFDEVTFERVIWEQNERIDSEDQYRRAYQSGSGALYFAKCDNSDETWLPLLEKAYAKAHGDYQAIEGGHTGEGIEDLTGGVTTELFTTDILDQEYFWREELMKVNEDFLFGCWTGVWGQGWGDRKGIVEGHAYSVMRAVEVDGHRLVLLKNPWGMTEWKGPWSDGSKEWTAEWLTKLDHRFGDDGNFWISYKDLLRKYQAFNRTRLFGPDWKVTSAWTEVSVPWKLDYHDTHFTFSLAKTGPVVLVLSQLDDRYFRGLEGQYRFELGFRLHKKGQEDYVVRSIAAFSLTRSANVELELEAGEYTVLMKIGATRNVEKLPVETVIRNYARERRDKLVTVGMSYVNLLSLISLTCRKACLLEIP